MSSPAVIVVNNASALAQMPRPASTTHRQLTQPLDSNNAEAHPIARGIARALRGETVYTDGHGQDRKRGPLRMISSKECQARADECFQLARAAKTPKQRAILFDMARTWETLGKHAARLEEQKSADESPQSI